MSNEKSNPSYAHDSRQVRWGRKGWWLFAAVALFFLLTEHQAHLFAALPYVLLLACPVMHFFMHGKHRGHAPHEPQRPRQSVGNPDPNPDEAHHEPR